jgi:restriction endonuclease S subunit
VLTTVQTAIEQQARLITLTRELKRALMRKLFTEGIPRPHRSQRPVRSVETEIGLVPESWEVVELEQVSEKPQYGFTESAQDKGTAQFLRITDIQDFGVNWANVPFCECPENLIEKYLLKNGDLVFARIGATTGKSFVINNPPKAVFASYLIRVRPHSEKLDSVFLGFYCQTKQYWQQIDAHKGSNLKGGVNSGIL